MLTRVFVPTRASTGRESNGSEGDTLDTYSIQTPSSDRMSRNSSSTDLARSIPMDVPNSPCGAESLENEDSGLSNSGKNTIFARYISNQK